ncbi:MAG: DsbA family protein [Actinomycetia bacterium]|nr:DsbA family protein [Actinomycetes bacterium]
MAKSSTAHDRRAAMRAAQEAEARRARTKRLVTVIAGGVALVLIVVAVVVLVNRHNERVRQAEITGTPGTASGTTPPSATADGSAILGNPSVKDAPLTLNLYLDYQCPICRDLEMAIGTSLETLAGRGDIAMRYNILTFQDDNWGNTASTRAAIASTCADTVGSFQAYHDTIFANQPAKEGTGYTDDQLRNTFATKAGLTGDALTRFQACYDARQTSAFVTQMDKLNWAELGAKFVDAQGRIGTPTLAANGTQVDLRKVTATMATDPDALLALLKQTAGLA